jgi:hypothetical protein
MHSLYSLCTHCTAYALTVIPMHPLYCLCSSSTSSSSTCSSSTSSSSTCSSSTCSSSTSSSSTCSSSTSSSSTSSSSVSLRHLLYHTAKTKGASCKRDIAGSEKWLHCLCTHCTAYALTHCTAYAPNAPNLVRIGALSSCRREVPDSNEKKKVFGQSFLKPPCFRILCQRVH